MRERERKLIMDHNVTAAAEETFPDAAAVALGSMFIVQDNKITLKAFFAVENVFLFFILPSSRSVGSETQVLLTSWPLMFSHSITILVVFL